MGKKLKSNFLFISTTLIITFLYNFNSFVSPILVIPFKYYNLKNNTSPFTPSSFLSEYYDDIIFSEVEVGTYDSPKNIHTFFTIKSSIFSFSQRKICTEKSYYNNNKSTSYQITDKISSENFEFFSDLKQSKKNLYKKINFLLDIKTSETEKPICADLGLKILNKYDNEKYNFINNLKNNNYISDYYVSFQFDSKYKPYDDYSNINGQLIIGELPHIYNKDKYNIKQYKNILTYISSNDGFIYYEFSPSITKCIIKDGEITELENEEKEKIILTLDLDFGLITGPTFYQNYIENVFFNKSEINKICQRNLGNVNYLDYVVFICDNEVKNKFNKFPKLEFYHKDLNYTFEFNYEDLFMYKDNKYYFKIIFSTLGELKQWRFGIHFFLKYQLVFDQDSKSIGIYDENILIDENNKNGKNSFWTIFAIGLIILLTIVLGIPGFFIYKVYISKNKRKKANELDDDGYDYFAKNQNSTDVGKLINEN